MNRIRKRLKLRYNQFSSHPLTKGKEYDALLRYVCFHLMIMLKGKMIYKWIGHLKFIGRKGEAGIVGNIYYGLYEFEESIFLLHLLNKNDLFLDVGANVGHYSLIVSGLKQTKSLAIEPVPKTYARLKEHIALNHLEKLIETRNVGVSNENGKLYFSTDRGTMDRIVDSTYENSVLVLVETIDSILADTVPLALKIDVEGYEKFALEGATKLLSNPNFKVIILELNNSGKIYEINDVDIYNIVIDLGFKPYSYNPKNRALKELINYNTHQFNTIFVRDLEFVKSRVISSSPIEICNQYF
ncbi:FkbM family methyltransferase [Gelidibacter japonicus]|uniref:FkbM family methyltransferase n=1 Tax=Gelidibacter japonicus TaxID=1962232 RepID=UPI002020BD7E|nr:FkbM family methyltransferase [Gelidibacter japonicus]MCL8006550.1 FkbM family methyltransferase [Gelidibacter japonicus]